MTGLPQKNKVCDPRSLADMGQRSLGGLSCCSSRGTLHMMVAALQPHKAGRKAGLSARQKHRSAKGDSPGGRHSRAASCIHAASYRGLLYKRAWTVKAASSEDRLGVTM